MELKQSHNIPLPIEIVWAGLNDIEVLAQAIPGCETLEKLSENELSAKVKLKIGPVSANFSGVVELSDVKPPYSYIITGSGKGGVAGAATGSAHVILEETEEGTNLSYTAQATITGKIAQLGARLIDSTAKKLANKFFENFITTMTSETNSK